MLYRGKENSVFAFLAYRTQELNVVQPQLNGSLQVAVQLTLTKIPSAKKKLILKNYTTSLLD